MMQAMKDRFVEITDMKRDYNYIWNLVDAGYPVYFIRADHIETGYPREEPFSEEKIKRTIGAGSTVKLKELYYFHYAGNTHVFLHLHHLIP
jgi:hypothetical protein